MPEFLRLVPPEDARKLLLAELSCPLTTQETIETAAAIDRACAEDIRAPHPLPEFPRSTVDGYAVLAEDTFGARDSLPVYLILTGEVLMGNVPPSAIAPGQCMLIHTGGMIPENANAVVMLEHTQVARGNGPSPRHQASAATRFEQGSSTNGTDRTEIEVLRPVATGENVIQVGQDVAEGQVVLSKGSRLRPSEIGGLMALGVTSLNVVRQPRIGLISSGDELVPPHRRPRQGQVRDVNAYTLASAVTRWGGVPALYGIIPDDPGLLEQMAARALEECDCVVISAGSSASVRDQTASVIDSLGSPGVLVHGVNTRPGKPTILGCCNGKGVLGLPGNPVSALVNAHLFLKPLLECLLGLPTDRPQAVVAAILTVNLPSEAGREDWWPVSLRRGSMTGAEPGASDWLAEPIFGQSNLIFRLMAADGLLRIPPDATGLGVGSAVEVQLL